MNNSKKIQTKKVKEVKLSEKPITSISKPWLITSLVLIVILIGALLFDQLYTPNIMTVDGKKYNAKDLSYYFYTVESRYASYNSMFGGDYWDMPISQNGASLRETAKKDAISESLRATILYNEAVKQGYKLTADEQKTVKTTVDDLYNKQLTKEEIRKNHFTKAFLTKMIEGTTLVSRFRQDKLKEAKIDEAKIKAGVSFDEFKQYDIEYLYAATQKTDAEGKVTEFSAKDKKAALDKLTSYYDKAKTTKDWSKVVPTDETSIIYKTSNFIKSDTSTFPDDFKAEIMKMNNNDISGVRQASTGYFIVRMVNNNSSERYNTEVSTAITTEQNKTFDKIYEEIVKTHPNKLNEGAIKHLKFGELTIVAK